MAGNAWGGTTVGTNYRGTRASQPPNWSFENRNPNEYDSANYVLGDLWLNTITEQVWVLVSLQGTTTSKGQLALWIEFGGGGDLDSLTGDTGGPVFGDANRNINTLGTAGQIVVTGNPATNTLTWSLDGEIATEYVCNTGSAIPAGGILNVLGGLTINTTGFGNTIEIEVVGDFATSYPTDSGTATPAGGILNIFGGTAGRDINTTGAGDTVRVELNNSITLGDLTPLVSTDALTVTTGDVTVSAGNLIFPFSNNAGTQGVVYHPGGLTFCISQVQNTYLGDSAGNLWLGVANEGVRNTAVGYIALRDITSGIDNSCFGNDSGTTITTGIQNSTYGSGSGLVLTTGSSNSFYGFQSGSSVGGVTTGSGNTLIGALTGTNYASSESNNIILGFNIGGTAAESNTCRIGNATGTGSGQLNRTFISGIRGITTGVNDAVAVLVDSANQLGTVSSSARYKDNIADMAEHSSKLLELKPRVFTYKEDPEQSQRFGLIAEEVQDTFPYLVANNKEGEPESVKYHELSAILLNEVIKLSKRVADLEERLG